VSPNLAAFLTSWEWAPPVLMAILLSGSLYTIGWHRLSGTLSRREGACPLPPSPSRREGACPLPPGGTMPAEQQGERAALQIEAVHHLRGGRVLYPALRYEPAGDALALPAGTMAPWRPWCFAGGLLSLAVALLSPIGVFGGLFFSLHMTQHMLLMVLVAPLLLLGSPVLPMLWALPERPRSWVAPLFAQGSPLTWAFNFATHPLIAMPLYLSAIAIWHIPTFYDAAQGRTVIHDLEHLFFLGTALLFWWPVVNPLGGPRRLSYLAAIPYFLPPMLVGNLVGALLTFADRPLYATYLNVPRLWGISVVQDQQLAGLIMWVPGGMVYIIPIFIMVTMLLREGREELETPAGAEQQRVEEVTQ